MTQRRYSDLALSNWFDAILDGTCPYTAGGAFCDLDGASYARAFRGGADDDGFVTGAAHVSHDDRAIADRFLMQEFKREGNPETPSGQRRMLAGFAGVAGFSVWRVWRLDDGRIGVLDMADPEGEIEGLSIAAYRRRVARWWGLREPVRDPDPAKLKQNGITTWPPLGHVPAPLADSAVSRRVQPARAANVQSLDAGADRDGTRRAPREPGIAPITAADLDWGGGRGR